jgi:hypothetical protein
MPQSPSRLDASRHRGTPRRARSHLLVLLGAGLLLAGHYGFAGVTFGRPQFAALALLFAGCAGMATYGLWDSRTFSGTPPVARRWPVAARYCVTALATLALAALGGIWIGGPFESAAGQIDAGQRWSPYGYAIPMLVAAFVALPLMTAVWLCLAVMAAQKPGTPGRRGRIPRHDAPRSALDEADQFERWIEQDFSAERNPAPAASAV